MESFAILLLIALAAALILPWINHFRLLQKTREIESLQASIDRLEAEIGSKRDASTYTPQNQTATEQTQADHHKPTPTASAPPPLPQKPEPLSVAAKPVLETAPITVPTTPPSSVIPETIQHEDASLNQKDWFGKITVWIGAAALLMAGFYMIKYSIDSGWLTPSVRLTLTTLFGLGLSAGGFIASIKNQLKANTRIGQALSGAGIACLYFSSYAAVHLFELIGTTAGFISMVGVTLLAVALSLKNGVPIAIMGMIGGFLTPLLMGSDNADTPLLFTYLFILYTGAQLLCIRRGWWGLLLCSIAGAYLWSGLLIAGHLAFGESSLPGGMLFVLGICTLNGIWSLMSRQATGGRRVHLLIRSIRLLTWSGGLLQSALLLYLGNFGAVDLGLFSILATAALYLAVLKEESFGWAAAVAYLLILFSILTSQEPTALVYFGWPIVMTLLFAVTAHFKAFCAGNVNYWRALSVSALTTLCPVAYLNRDWFYDNTPQFTGFWILMTGCFAVLILIAAEHLIRRKNASNTTVSIYSAFAFLLIVFGLWTTIPSVYMPHALSVVALAACLYWKRRNFVHLEILFSILMLAWAAYVSRQGALCIDYLFGMEVFGYWVTNVTELTYWIVGFAATCVAMICSKKVTLKGWPEALKVFLGSILLLAVTHSYYLAESFWMTGWSAEVRSGGLTTVFTVITLLSYLIPDKKQIRSMTPLLIASIVGYRIIRFHITGSGAGGEPAFLNALLLQFGIPLAGAILCILMARIRVNIRSVEIYQAAAMALGFLWATFIVQDVYGDARLFSEIQTNGELYTYSVVWLALGIIYQTFGLIRNARVLHIGSLCLLLLTIGKVFLIDGSELVGIFRVLSFLGLGFALIGIGFFYNKVVFARNQNQGSQQ